MLCPALRPSTQERPAGVGPEQTHESDQRAGALSCEHRLREMWLFSLKEGPWEALIEAFQFLQGPDKKEKYTPFGRACCDGTRGNGFKLEGKLILGIRKRFFTMTVVK